MELLRREAQADTGGAPDGPRARFAALISGEQSHTGGKPDVETWGTQDPDWDSVSLGPTA